MASKIGKSVREKLGLIETEEKKEEPKVETPKESNPFQAFGIQKTKEGYKLRVMSIDNDQVVSSVDSEGEQLSMTLERMKLEVAKYIMSNFGK